MAMLRPGSLVAAALAVFVIASRIVAHSCGDGSQVAGMAVQQSALDGAPASTHGTGADGYPMCTPAGNRVFCLVNHDYHRRAAGEQPCCVNGSDPTHGNSGAQEREDDGIDSAREVSALLQIPTVHERSVQIQVDDSRRHQASAQATDWSGKFSLHSKALMMSQISAESGAPAQNSWLHLAFADLISFGLLVLILGHLASGNKHLSGHAQAPESPVLASNDALIPVSKEVLLTVGIITTALQGGGIIFGFSSFAERLMELPGTPFTASTVSVVFGVGHDITALCCIISGLMLDYVGPRFCVVSGLFIESLGHFLIAYATDVPRSVTTVAYGLVGLGGCHVLLAALTFTAAFQRSNLVNSILTCAFQAGAFVFMALPFVEWRVFFISYGVFCILGALVTGVLYPTKPLPSYDEEQGDDSAADGQEHVPLMKVLLSPGVMWFLMTFMVAGSAFIYGAGEFPAAMRSKDRCQWDHKLGDFTHCEGQALQDKLNYFAMPFFGNFIAPVAMAMGMIIDRWGFAVPAIIMVLSTQAFVLALWVLNLHWQYLTLLMYNIANSAVFTIQNAYICAVGHEHIGSLFAISNLVMGAGNFVSIWLNLNPFGENEGKVTDSLMISSIFWLLITSPLYFWAVVESRRTTSPPDELNGIKDKLLYPVDGGASV